MTHHFPSNRKILATVLAVLAFGIASQGCSSSDTDAPAPYTYEELETLVASSYCSALHDCCASAHFTYDESACLPQVSARRWFFLALKRDDTGTVVYHRDAAEKCAAAIRTRMALCSDGRAAPGSTAGAERAVRSACADVVGGTARPGEKCVRQSGQREQYTHCANAGPGTGAACGWLHDDGSPGNSDGTSLVGTCYQWTKPNIGEPCDASSTLVDGKYEGYRHCDAVVSYCEPGGGGAGSGVCAPWKPIGQPCKPYQNGVYEVIECDRNEGYCSNETSTCIRWAGKGETCGRGLPQCAHGFECRAPAGCDSDKLPGCKDETCVEEESVIYSASTTACQVGPRLSL